MSLLDRARADQARAAAQELKKIAGLGPDQISEIDGKVVADGMSFTYDRGLRLLGFCPLCGMEVPSTVIRRAADLAALARRFRAGPHDCVDA